MPINPLNFASELIYTTIVVILCWFVYYKTKEIYALSKYQGIKYFRTSFLLFGLAYLTRFVFHIFKISIGNISFQFNREIFFPSMLVVTAYLSTMAIFYLAYSTVWKRIKYKHFLIFANLIAIIVAVVSWTSKSPFIIMLVQLPLLIFTLVAILLKHRKKKKSNARTLYFLITLFWLVNLYLLGPKWRIVFEMRIILQVLSLVVFSMLIYKVTKWIK
ncbi:MAG: hypothetical protein U9R08_03350 [Nanoarchaeota archaeon]|nr:hypothetical protein [Nanoarchaeota archaeon]